MMANSEHEQSSHKKSSKKGKVYIEQKNNTTITIVYTPKELIDATHSIMNDQIKNLNVSIRKQG